MTSTPTAIVLQDLNDDTLIHVFCHLAVADILTMRRVSKRMFTLSKLRTVWQDALSRHVLDRGFPFPNIDIDALTLAELEHHTRSALKLSQFWTTRKASPRPVLSIPAGNSATGVSEVKFLPARPDWLITVSRGIWSVITCWDTSGRMGNGSDLTKYKGVAEWTPRETILTGVAVNSDPHSEAYLAVSMMLSSSRARIIEVFTITSPADGALGAFVPLRKIDLSFRALTFRGDILAVADDINESQLINWRSGEYAVLWGTNEPSEHNFQHNRCLQVVLTPHCVLVIRARSLEIFRNPRFVPRQNEQAAIPTAYNQPAARQQLGWIDGMSVMPQIRSSSHAAPSPLSIVVRAETDNPWANDKLTLDLYTLQPNPAFRPDQATNCALPSTGERVRKDSDIFTSRASATPPEERTSPYLLPPVINKAYWTSRRGHLRCRDILVGPHGTALWIRPRPARALDLTAYDVHSSEAQRPGRHSPHGEQPQSESLVAALLPSRMRESLEWEREKEGRDDEEEEDGLRDARTLWHYGEAHGSWMAIDYDEARGLVALGDSLGTVTILQL